MDERKRRILQAITDDYIETAEPVGSRTIARKYELGVSPATIRNEMADLEELGYLEQPHTSAGRIPSDKGYRYYVDSLMNPAPLPPAQKSRLRREVAGRYRALEDVVHRAARLLAAYTEYTAIILAPRPAEVTLQQVQFLPVRSPQILIVVVAEPGFVLHRLTEVEEEGSIARLPAWSEALTHRLRGVTGSGLTGSVIAEIRQTLSDRRLFETLLDLLQETLEGSGEDRVILEGVINILNHPEFQDVERAKAILGLLEEREALYGLLSSRAESGELSVSIGREHGRRDMQDCSVVTATYSLGGTVIGAVGILGPTRMKYARAVAIVEYAAASLSEALSGK